MRVNFEIAPLLLLTIFTVEVRGQTRDANTPDLTRDMRTVSLSRIENPQIEKLSNACIAQRGRWIFRREAKVDCFAVQVNGFVKGETGESRIEYPLFIAIFGTLEEAKVFVINMGGRIAKDKDSLMIFKSPSVTFLSFPVPKNLYSPTADSQTIFLVSKVEITLDIFSRFSVPIGRIKEFVPSLKDELDFNFTKVPTEDLKKIFEAEDVKPMSWVYTYGFVTFSQVTSKIPNT